MITQPLWTWLTGLPLPRETPLIRWTPMGRMLTAFAVLALSVTGAGAAVLHGGWAWLAYPPLAMLATGALRALYIVTGHFAAHQSFAATQRGNPLIGELVSTVTLTLNHAEYEVEHARYHHSSRLGTPMDPDTCFITSLGFLPGMALEALRQQLARTMVSPRFHLRFLAARLRANLVTPSRARRGAALALHGGLLAAAIALDLVPAYLMGWWVPLTGLYHVSALLQFMSEHRWLRVRAAGERPREHQAKLTFGRFLGDPLPAEGLRGWARVGAWARWSLRLAVLHLPARLFVLVGDLPQHDLHHARPRGEWANAAFTRRDLLDDPRAGWTRTDEDELHGSLFRMIDEVLRGLAERPPLSEDEQAQLRGPLA